MLLINWLYRLLVFISLDTLLGCLLKLGSMELYGSNLAEMGQLAVELDAVLLHDAAQVGIVEAHALDLLDIGVDQSHELVATLHHTMPVQVQTYISSMFLMIRQENFTSPIMRFLRNTGKKKQDRMLM